MSSEQNQQPKKLIKPFFRCPHCETLQRLPFDPFMKGKPPKAQGLIRIGTIFLHQYKCINCGKTHLED